jgi:prepilin-type N-terminal cleavage/methylation domain-containing protein
MSLMTNRTTKMPRQTGFTLIEVMVTVIVLAIGLLGLAGLQALHCGLIAAPISARKPPISPTTWLTGCG